MAPSDGLLGIKLKLSLSAPSCYSCSRSSSMRTRLCVSLIRKGPTKVYSCLRRVFTALRQHTHAPHASSQTPTSPGRRFYGAPRAASAAAAGLATHGGHPIPRSGVASHGSAHTREPGARSASSRAHPVLLLPPVRAHRRRRALRMRAAFLCPAGVGDAHAAGLHERAAALAWLGLPTA